MDRFYHTTETAVRVREDFWFDCPENRELIHRKAMFFNGDEEWPNPKPLTIFVMRKDNLGCIGFIDPGRYTASPQLAEPVAASELEEAA